jgi:hypothetical protein
MLSVFIIIIALARPQKSLDKQKITSEGIDIVLALDISSSMLAQDFKPDRIEAAKNVAVDFIKGRPNDRIGLVTFAAESFTMVLKVAYLKMVQQLALVWQLLLTGLKIVPVKAR